MFEIWYWSQKRDCLPCPTSKDHNPRSFLRMTFLFFVFSALALVGGIGVVVNRNPVSSAFSMVISFLGLAALFIQLDAYLVGVLQILVYAGANMVKYNLNFMIITFNKSFTFNIKCVATFIFQWNISIHYYYISNYSNNSNKIEECLTSTTTTKTTTKTRRLNFARLPN